MENAYNYIIGNKGIDTSKSYPYIALNGKCHFNKDTIGATEKSYAFIQSGDERALQLAVAKFGPISVAIDASHDSFQFYSEGIYYEPRCSSSMLDHAVLVVGYDVDHASGREYWIVKNSWGKAANKFCTINLNLLYLFVFKDCLGVKWVTSR